MFIVFEGIDGSGKTTLSNRAAARLRERGLAVEHVREGGRFASQVTQAMRELGRDARNLALSPRAELMLYLGREVQLLDEVTRPALGRADVVFADRFVYTAEALAVAGRGLDAAEVAPLVEAAAGGVTPDLVILVDVHPRLARARRRVSKIIEPVRRPPSRKGLTGKALQRRLRAGYRAMAARAPERWVVVDNNDADLDALVDAVVEAILAARDGGAAAARARLPAPAPIREATGGIAGAAAALLAWIDRRAGREPGLAAYFLGGLAGPGIDDRREALASEVPTVVAAGLRALDDPASWRLRRALRDQAPGRIAASLTGPAATRDEAAAMLHDLAGPAPREVASALRGRDDDVAWAVRARLDGNPAMSAVGGIAGARAWEVRDRWLAAQGGVDGLDDFETAATACSGVGGVAGPRAWEVRAGARAAAPISALTATRGLDDDRAWSWRTKMVTRAPRAVMRSLSGLDAPRAWDLRERVIARCSEALDSILGLDDTAAWRLRSDHVDTWPAAAVKSLGPLLASDRGHALLERALRCAPDDLALWRYAAMAASPDGRSRW